MSLKKKISAAAKRVADQVRDALGLREDAFETAVLARQLDYVESETYDIEYAENKALKFVPLDTKVPVGAKTFTYRQWDYRGMAKAIHDYASDFGRVTLLAKEFSQKVQEFGTSYGYSLHDLEAAAMANVPLDTELAAAARAVCDNRMDDVIANGYPEADIPGFINHPNVPLVTLPNGDWQNSGTTSEEILEDMHYLAARPFINTLEVHSANTMLLDSESYNTVSTRQFSATDNRTILQVFLQNSPHITQVDQWLKLNEANADGDGPRIMVYERNPRVVRAIVPRLFTQLPMLQTKPTWWETECLIRLGGCSWRYPLGAAYADNAAA